MTIEQSSCFYLTSEGNLNNMSLEGEHSSVSPKESALRRISMFVKSHTGLECSSCQELQRRNETLEREVELKRAELKLLESNMQKVRNAYMDACIEISELKKTKSCTSSAKDSQEIRYENVKT